MPKTIKISKEYFDEATQTFKYSNTKEFTIEHSLLSISKWEAKWHKAFLDDKTEKSHEEIMDYIKCMTITQNVPDDAYDMLSEKDIREIKDYIDDPMTATTFSNRQKSGRGELITSEIVYYWMISMGIPVEFQKWHINRLLVLIRVCSEKNTPGKKMSRNELLQRNASLNAKRRAALHSKG